MTTPTIRNSGHGREESRPTNRAVYLTMLLLLSAAWGCTRSDANETADAAWKIPELKERAAGLDPGDFVMVKERAESFRMALKANPSDTKALTGLAQVFMYEARVTGDHPYYYPAAESLLDRALALDPDDYQAVISKASVLLSLHRFDDALVVAQKAVRLSPDAAAGYGALVDACVELGRYDEAVAAADRMVAVRPDLKSYSRVSYLREIHGDGSGAIEAMKLAVDAGAPGSEEKAWARTTLGVLYLEQGKPEAAEREFRMTSLERERYPFALAGLARVFIAKGMNDSALALLNDAIALVPEFSFVELQAEIHRVAGNHHAADSLVAMVESMLREDEASGHVMDRELALLYAAHGIKLDEALVRAGRELERRPENIDAQDAMAYVLLRAGKPREAMAYCAKARRLGTKGAAIIAHAALIDAELGNANAGVEQLRNGSIADAGLSPLLRRQVAEKAGGR